MGHVECAAKDDIGDRIKTADRKILGPGNEIARGVVDEARQRAMLLPDDVVHLADHFRAADIARVRNDLATMFLDQLRCRRLAHFAAPAADMHLRA